MAVTNVWLNPMKIEEGQIEDLCSKQIHDVASQGSILLLTVVSLTEPPKKNLYTEEHPMSSAVYCNQKGRTKAVCVRCRSDPVGPKKKKKQKKNRIQRVV